MNENQPERMPNTPPFVRFVCSAIPMVFDDSLSYYEALCALWKYVQGMTDVINNNATLEEEYILKFNELKTFVDTYFDNLDVQEEINNKLDEMAEDGTLAKIIGEYLFAKAKFIFPKFNASMGAGDTSAIVINDKTILIDCYTDLQYDITVKDLLVNNNIEHIDYLIISHYDGDHMGGLPKLISDGYVDSTTVAYLPARVTTYGAEYNNNQTITVNSLTTAGATIVYPLEGSSVEIEELKLTFNNTNTAYLDSLTNKDPNQCSMFVLIEHHNTKALYSGDAGIDAESRMREVNFPSTPIDLYKVPHHGVNGYCDYRYVKALAPKYGVIIGGVRSYINTGEMIYGQEESILNTCGTKVFPTFTQNNYLTFESDGNNIYCTNGKPNKITNRFINLSMYVDINAPTSAIQDGTQDHPFSNLNQALGFIPISGDVRATINVADGDYTGIDYNPVIYGEPNVKITINGNSLDKSAVKFPTFHIENSNIAFNNLTICADNQIGIESVNSIIYTNNVDITTKSGSISSYNGIKLDKHSNMYAKDTLIENCRQLIVLSNGSSFNCLDNVTFGDYSDTYSLIRGTDCEFTSNGELNFSDPAEKLKFKAFKSFRVYQPVQIMDSHTAQATDVNLLVNANQFAWLEIYYHSIDGFYTSVKIYNPNGKNVGLFTPQTHGGPALKNKQAKMSINGTLLHIFAPVLVEENATTSIDNPFNIDKVIGGYIAEYVDLAS